MLLLLPLSYLLPQTSSIVFILAKSRRGVLFLGVLPILAKSIGGCYFQQCYEHLGKVHSMCLASYAYNKLFFDDQALKRWLDTCAYLLSMNKEIWVHVILRERGVNLFVMMFAYKTSVNNYGNLQLNCLIFNIKEP